METIKDTLRHVISVLEAKKNNLPGGNPQEWMERAFNKKELRHIKFHYFRQGVLGMSVDSSAWLYHFNLKKEDLMAQFNKKDAVVKNIRFCLGGDK